jgi:hypothetical protein
MRAAYFREIDWMKAAWPEQRPQILEALGRHFAKRVALAEGKRG